MTKKKIIYSIIFIVVLTGVLVILKLVLKSPYNLTKPEYKSLEIDGKKYSFIIQRYDPPFMFYKLLESEEKMDRTMPEGVSLGVQSATNRDWFLSLLDKKLQGEYLDSNKKLVDKIFKDGKRNIVGLNEQNFKFLYKVIVEIDEKQYAIIYGRPNSKGKDYAPGTMTFIKEADGWKQTRSLRDPISSLVGGNDYEDFKKLTK